MPTDWMPRSVVEAVRGVDHVLARRLPVASPPCSALDRRGVARELIPRALALKTIVLYCRRTSTENERSPRTDERNRSWVASRSAPRTRTDIELYYEDHGTGQPVVLIHGYPLDGTRGRSRPPRSSTPATASSPTTAAASASPASRPTGYDYDTFAADLNAVLDDPRPARRRPRRLLDGHRRGRPLPRHLRLGARREGRFLASLEPFLLQTDDNPDGRPAGRLRRHSSRPSTDDRYAFFTGSTRTSSTSTRTSAPASARRRCAANTQLAYIASPYASVAAPARPG